MGRLLELALNEEPVAEMVREAAVRALAAHGRDRPAA